MRLKDSLRKSIKQNNLLAAFIISYKTPVNIVVSTPKLLTCLPFFKSTIGS